MPCHNCRGPISEIDRFCPECGTPVGTDDFHPACGKHTIWFGNRLLKSSWILVVFSCLGVVTYFLSSYMAGTFGSIIRTVGLIISVPGLPLILILTPVNISASVIHFRELERTQRLLFFIYTPLTLIILGFVAIPTLWAFIDFLTGGLFLGY